MGNLDGLAWALFAPHAEPPWPGIVILHGANSQKENHFDFARAAAQAGFAALGYDQRGHGESQPEMAPVALGDVPKMARLLAEQGADARRIAVRGSSMGGFFAIHAAALYEEIVAVIAICPAGEEHLLRGLQRGELEMRADEPALRAWLEEHDLREAAEMLDGKPLLLLHAEGDESIPFSYSEELYARTAGPRKLVVVPGGHHRSLQHDAELQGMALRWLARQLRESG